MSFVEGVDEVKGRATNEGTRVSQEEKGVRMRYTRNDDG